MNDVSRGKKKKKKKKVGLKKIKLGARKTVTVSFRQKKMGAPKRGFGRMIRIEGIPPLLTEKVRKELRHSKNGPHRTEIEENPREMISKK